MAKTTLLSQAAMPSDLYNTDFYVWANGQAVMLRAGDLARADVEHIAGKIESMGRGKGARCCTFSNGRFSRATAARPGNSPSKTRATT